MTYNLSLITSALTPADLLTGINDELGGFMFQFLILCIYIIMILSLKRFGMAQAFASSSWVCFLLSIFLVAGKFLMPIYLLFFIITATISTVIVYRGG